MKPPKISVVLATYNASHLLRYALGSLQHQTLEDWEAVVVGDCCTDDTEEMIEGLGDSRIQFHNLRENSGQQARPNNIGVEIASGQNIAFLNHDDLFLPEHLKNALAQLDETGAEILISPVAEIPVEQRHGIELGEIVTRLAGFSSNSKFDPRRFHVASSWVMRRTLAERVGPWRLEHETYVTPSQDWLFRAWRRRARMICPEQASVIAIYAGERQNFYRERQISEHEFVFREVIETQRLRPALDAALSESHAARTEKRPAAYRRGRKRGFARWRRKLTRRLESLLMHCGVHPNIPGMILRHGGHGGYIRSIQKRTG
ncbi:MAG: glycosyltransferase family 2 protein [Myxococcota bacterium]